MKNSTRNLPFIAVIVFLLFNTACKKDETNNNNNNNGGTVTDVDGNVYHTVTIGGQVWLKENLKVTHYRDGTPIVHVSDGWDWWHTGAGAWCDYDNNTANGATYGKMYNWYAVNTGILCPQGFHVPTSADWTVLENFLGTTDPGGKLKETGLAHRADPNATATNSSGFTALPGGYRSSTGSFFSLTFAGHWWSATEGSDTAYGRYRYVDFSLGGFYGNEDYKVDGLSVRCIKD